MTRIALALALAGGCSDLQNFGGPAPPLAAFQIVVNGDLAPLRPTTDPSPARLRVALVWGRQWLVEPLCVLPPDNTEVEAVLNAGCRDPLGFIPARVDVSVPVVPGVPTELDLFTLPSSDLMVGDLTARVAYASLVVFDDLDDDGTLELARPNRPPDVGRPGDNLPTATADRVYGASFITMTEPDLRVGYREGDFSPVAAFYPRAGCPDPAPGFSLLMAGGFSLSEAEAATLENMLPMEDPAGCDQWAPSAMTVPIQLVSPIPTDQYRSIPELACTERLTDSSVRYRDPADPGDLTGRVGTCARLPTFGGDPSPTLEFVVDGLPTDSCMGLTHFVLKGCSQDPNCADPDWDHTAAPPSWWPCP